MPVLVEIEWQTQSGDGTLQCTAPDAPPSTHELVLPSTQLRRASPALPKVMHLPAPQQQPEQAAEGCD